MYQLPFDDYTWVTELSGLQIRKFHPQPDTRELKMLKDTYSVGIFFFSGSVMVDLSKVAVILTTCVSPLLALEGTDTGYPIKAVGTGPARTPDEVTPWRQAWYGPCHARGACRLTATWVNCRCASIMNIERSRDGNRSVARTMIWSSSGNCQKLLAVETKS